MWTAISKNHRFSCWLPFCLVLGLGSPALCAAQEGNGNVTADPLARTSRQRLPTPALEEDRVTAVPEDFAKAKLSPGDLLRFGVYDEPQMDATLRVTSDGKVDVPLAGPVQVGGMSVSDARSAIKAALVAGEFFKEPEVRLDIAQLASGRLTIMGEVQSPGRYQILSPLSLGAALSLAGGETVDAGSDIEIQRPSASGDGKIDEHVSNDRETSADAFSRITVEPGDVITVQRAGIVYVLGSVHRPGGYLMLNRGRLNVLQALSLAGGTMLEASTSTIRIIHRDEDKLVETRVKLSDYTNGRLPAPFLGDKDIVFVPSNKAKSVAVNGAVIIGAAASSLVYRVP